MNEEAEYVCLTTDTWTSNATQNYIAVTAHYISKNWKLKSVLLECIHFPESHTAEHLRNEILRVCMDFDISRKVHTIVSDNAPNITKAIKLTGKNHLPCVAHTLNLVVQDAIELIQPLHTKVKGIVKHFHRSTVAAAKLAELQKILLPHNVPLKLIMDVLTRWNSTYHMFSRICAIQEPLEATIAVLHADIDGLTNEDWLTLKQFCIALEPFHQITEELSAEKNVSASKVRPTFFFNF